MIKRLFLTGMISALLTTQAFAFWIWTPETNRWINPKYAVKDTPKLQLEYSLEFYEQKDFKKAMAELQKLIAHYPKAREAAEAQYYIGLCREGLGEPYKAVKDYQVVIEKYPFSERAPEIVKRQYELGESLMEGAAEKKGFVATIIGGDYDVIDVFRTVIRNAPYGPYAAPAQYKIGLYLQEKQLYQEARDEFEKTINDYPESEWASAAKYQIALSDAKRSADAQYSQKVTKAAVEEFKHFVKENPDAELSQKAKDHINSLREKEAENSFIIAEYYEKRKQYESAKIYYSSIISDYDNTTWASKALERLQSIGKQVK